MPVILLHAGLGPLSGGFLGVDVFFVISGYLITSILMADLAGGRFSIVTFYERRARRILPALVVVALACVPFAWRLMTPQEFEDFGQSLVSIAVFASNILFWRESGYFELEAATKPLLHTWSLAIEEQFYIFFPLLLLALWRLGRRWIWGVTAALGVASLALAGWGARAHPEAAFYLMPTRAWELLAGAGCAYAAIRHGGTWRSPALALTGLLLLVASMLLFEEGMPHPSFLTIVPVAATCLVILCATPETGAGRLLASRPFVWTGLVSYSAYLWHQPVLAFARIWYGHAPPAPVMAGLVLLTLGLAWLSWRFVEQPFRAGRGGLVLTRARLFSGAAVAGAAVLAVGGVIAAGQGFPDRFGPGDLRAAYLATAASSPKRLDCHAVNSESRSPKNACTYFGADVRIAVLGDSHATELAYAIARLKQPDGIGIRHYTFSACAPSFGTGEATECAAYTDEAVEDILSRPRIDTVVVSYRIHRHLNGEHDLVYPGQPDEVSPKERERRMVALRALIQRLQQGGRTVVYVLQAPELPAHVDRLVHRASADAATVPGVPLAWWTDRRAFLDRRMASLPTGTLVVDPARLFCDRTQCHAGRHGRAYYFDAHHPSVVGAGMVAREVLATLERQASLR
ncbi:acyltransferase [Rhodobacteraceae bacterium MCCB 386]|nr:acyltransferase [Roseitranquillus sediminis]